MTAKDRHERIKMQLRLRGSSLASVARELGVAKASVTSVCKGIHESQRIKASIAAKLGSTPSALWPKPRLHKRNAHGGESPSAA